jgi:hypothetical protein
VTVNPVFLLREIGVLANETEGYSESWLLFQGNLTLRKVVVGYSRAGSYFYRVEPVVALSCRPFALAIVQPDTRSKSHVP